MGANDAVEPSETDRECVGMNFIGISIDFSVDLGVFIGSGAQGVGLLTSNFGIVELLSSYIDLVRL